MDDHKDLAREVLMVLDMLRLSQVDASLHMQTRIAEASLRKRCQAIVAEEKPAPNLFEGQ